MKLQDNYDVGIYCRLSRDDNNGNLESMSIANQRNMLTDYVKEKGWNLRECYIDDGFSGTNFDRPEFKRMIHDVELGKINCIVTKDLSRLGRNYVQTGHYTDEYFVEHGIRFIAINDSIDTLQDNNDIAAFHHVLNELYPKQVSKKVRQVKKANAEKGKFMGSQAPFGYKKSPLDKHILIIDEDAAKIVFRIFSEFASGDSARLIADRFNREGIDSPRFYHYRNIGRENPYAADKNIWGSATVLNLLRNEVYIGNMVQGKRKVASFKTKKVKAIAQEDWIVVKNTHEPIVSNVLWERVHSRLLNKKKTRVTKKETVGLFSGLLKCADCGCPLAYMRKPLKDREIGVYRCSRYNNNGGNACSTHYIQEDVLAHFVFNDIRRYAVLATSERELLTERLLYSIQENKNGAAKELQKKQKEAEKRLSAINSNIKSLYEDKCSGKISENIFYDLLKDFSKEKIEFEGKLSGLKEQAEKAHQAESEVAEWLRLISSQIDISELDKVMIMELIVSITISEGKKVNGERTQEITIEYRFVGNLSHKNKEDIA